MAATKPLRIIHCFRSPVGGIFRHVRDLAQAQSAAGHKVGIVCDSSTGGAHEERLFDSALPYLELGVRRTRMQRHIGPGDLASAWRTFKLIKELRPDVLHGHGAKGGVYARLFGTLLRVSRSRVARVYSLHGGSLHYDEDTVVGRIFFTLERLMERFTDHLLFVSDYERQTYARKIGTPPIPNSLVYNGLRTEEFEPVETRSDAADFLYIGMMRSLKGPDLFIDALARTEKRIGRPVSAVMVGDGSELPTFQAQAEQLGLSPRISFLPSMPARQAFAMARAIVVPSRAEAMPYIVLEALAAGMPMIATAVGGIPEIFVGRESLLAEPNADAIGEKMINFLQNPIDFKSEMPAGNELRSRFGADVMSAAVERVYVEAMSV